MAANFVDWLKAQREQLGAAPLEAYQIPEALRAGSLHTVFQPLVDLARGDVFAYEALLRGSAPAFGSPVHAFEQAVQRGCCGLLGRFARELAVDGCRAWPLFLNVHPKEFDEGWLVRPDDPIFRHDAGVYLEITESVPLSHVALCHSVLREIRAKAISLAVDDLGAGYSNLKYIADLAPEVVKLDRQLIRDLPSNARLRTVVRALVRLCEDLGAKVVAEGLERPEEVLAARDEGMHYGQGYLLARPAYPPPRTLGFRVG